MNRDDLPEDTLVGGTAGFLATLPMTLTMVLLHRLLPATERFPLPPRQITMKMAEEAGVKRHLSAGQRKAATYVAHFGYGAAAGAVYGIASREVPGPAAAKGVLFGLIVWTVSYLGLLPAARILPPATEHPAGRNAVMIAAHVVWGGVLGMVAEYLSAEQPWKPRRSSWRCCRWLR